MKVITRKYGYWRIIGNADIPDGAASEYVARLFGSESIFEERFSLVTAADLDVNEFAAGEVDSIATAERLILAGEGQLIELLPNWRPGER